MQVTEATEAPSGDVGETRDGIQDSKLLLWGKEGTPTNYKLNLSRAVTDWKAPRHKHNFDQFRYPLAGEFVYGDRVLPVGHVAYFPEGIAYGPQIRREGLEIVLCQIGGASGNGFLSKAQRRKAHAELAERGSFEKGVYSWIDAQGNKHNQDSAEAVYEQAVGGKSVYPAPRYADIIVMDPENFAWMPLASHPGVAMKWLGTFTERETRVGFIRIDEGASYPAGSFDGVQLCFLVEGQIQLGGKTHPKHTAFGFEPNEGPITLTAKQNALFLTIIGPKFQVSV
jgi:hypothetical protein